jgi:hypothetical protein
MALPTPVPLRVESTHICSSVWDTTCARRRSFFGTFVGGIDDSALCVAVRYDIEWSAVGKWEWECSRSLRLVSPSSTLCSASRDRYYVTIRIHAVAAWSIHIAPGWLATYVTPSSYARRKLLARNCLVFTMFLKLKEGSHVYNLRDKQVWVLFLMNYWSDGHGM